MPCAALLVMSKGAPGKRCMVSAESRGFDVADAICGRGVPVLCR